MKTLILMLALLLVTSYVYAESDLFDLKVDYGGYGKNLRHRDHENYGGKGFEHYENIYD